jgi:2-C-methyl-D-erythritol 4-phosphate cytidylyltransferase
MSNRPQPSRPLRIAVLIPAAGTGERMRADGEIRSKVLLPLGGEALLRHSVRAFGDLAVSVVARQDQFPALDSAFADRVAWPRLGAWIAGGAERQDSVRLGLAALAAQPDGPPDRILVHDGARPLCSPKLIGRVLAELDRHAAVVPALPVYDTVREVARGGDGHPAGSENGLGSGGQAPLRIARDLLRLCQTPQGFHWETLWQAHVRAHKEGFVGTDDGQLVERLGQAVALVPGERRNLKVTLPDDLALAEWILGRPAWGTS